MTITESFFEELENLLRKHLGDDWTWNYKDSYHPLIIYSGKLGEMWEKEMEEGDEQFYE
tara:strand:+ start:172 stop:348 length:177 start_codon:yes stop_codon:yes gene_type:complete